MILSVFPKNNFFGYSWSTPPWYRCYYPHRSRDALSPVCGIFYKANILFLGTLLVCQIMCINVDGDDDKGKYSHKNPAYGRQSISRPMRIIAPIPQKGGPRIPKNPIFLKNGKIYPKRKKTSRNMPKLAIHP